MLSAAAAVGVSVAFGAPIGGVLFSLEEVNPQLFIRLVTSEQKEPAWKIVRRDACWVRISQSWQLWEDSYPAASSQRKKKVEKSLFEREETPSHFSQREMFVLIVGEHDEDDGV